MSSVHFWKQGNNWYWASNAPTTRSRRRVETIRTENRSKCGTDINGSGGDQGKSWKATSWPPHRSPKALSLTAIQTRLVWGTFPFNFQIYVYFKGNLIYVALNRVQQTPLRDTWCWELFLNLEQLVAEALFGLIPFPASTSLPRVQDLGQMLKTCQIRPALGSQREHIQATGAWGSALPREQCGPWC